MSYVVDEGFNKGKTTYSDWNYFTRRPTADSGRTLESDGMGGMVDDRGNRAEKTSD